MKYRSREYVTIEGVSGHRVPRASSERSPWSSWRLYNSRTPDPILGEGVTKVKTPSGSLGSFGGAGQEDLVSSRVVSLRFNRTQGLVSLLWDVPCIRVGEHKPI